MKPQISITTATDVDIQEISDLVNSAYRGESSKQGWTTEAELLDGARTDPNSLLQQMMQPGQTILKAIDSTNKIIGCVSLQEKTPLLYLGMLTVNPHLQANGIGKELLVASEIYAKAQGLTAIEMTVISVRAELIAWYVRKGYVATGETRAFPTDTKFGIKKQELQFLVLEKKM